MLTVNLDSNLPLEVDKGHCPNYPVHQHNCAEIVFVLGGEATHIINNHEYQTKTGDVFVIKGQSTHGYIQTKNLNLCNIRYKIDNLINTKYNLTQQPGLQMLFVIDSQSTQKEDYESKLNLSLNELNYIDEITDIMEKIYLDLKLNKKNNHSPVELQPFFSSLIIYLSQLFMSKNKFHTEKLSNLAEAVNYIENHYCEPIKVKDIAEKTYLSTRHFRRLFKENYHTSPINYITQLRIRQSCELLSVTDKNITEIAKESGFSSSSYYSRKFKEILGISPSEYRKENKSKTWNISL